MSALRDAFARARSHLEGDAELAAATAGLDLLAAFTDGSDTVLQTLPPSRPDDVAPGSPQLVLRAPPHVWARALVACPEPGYQSITALIRCTADFHVAADPLLFAQSLHGLERLLELLRPPAPAVNSTGVARDPTLITGSYRDLQGHPALRIYFERSGRGIPLLMLHTAGADSRQFHDLLSDVELGERWAMTAFDMPGHGRSFPAIGTELQARPLTQAAYIDCIGRVIRQIVGEPVVLMGCSMGAAAAIAFAALHPQLLRGVIALEAPDRSPGRLNPYLRHPKVNQSAYAQAYVRGLMSPASPARHRALATWYYSQGGFGVYAGDLRFYSVEYDGTAVAGKIDTRRTPVHLLTGEYDYSADPASTRRLADLIPGARVRTMRGLGHFPMTEHPDLFRSHLLPVLESLAKPVATGAGA
ncbi:MAG: alpha/beta fold hydrolase [Lautropia sp.]